MFENVLPGMAHNAWNEGVTLALRFGAGGPAYGMPGFGRPFAMLENRHAMPAATEVFIRSQMPDRTSSFSPAYVDPGRAKFLEIQKMEWDYKPPSAIKLPKTNEWAWFKPTPYEPIIPKPTHFLFDRNPAIAPIPIFNEIPHHKPIKLWEPEPIIDYKPLKPYVPAYTELYKSPIIETWKPKPVVHSSFVHYHKPEPYRLPDYTYHPPTLKNPSFNVTNHDFGFQPIKVDSDLFPKRGGMHDSFNIAPSGDIFNGHTTVELKGAQKVRMSWEINLEKSSIIKPFHKLY